MRKDIKVKFTGFWPSFNINDNKFVNILKTKHNVCVLDSKSKECPDLLVYSYFNKGEHLDYDCIKIYYTGENDFPDFNECDYALSFHPFEFGDRHLRYPLYTMYGFEDLTKPMGVSDLDAVGRGFCSLVLRNNLNWAPKRLEIINAVDTYKPVAYGGPYRNNVGGKVKDKISFISKYKFNLALENSKIDGYITEKIVEPMLAGTVPIYWGSDMVKKEFNHEAFINVDDYSTVDSFMEALKRIDNDNAEYLKILRAPKLLPDIDCDFDTRLADFLDNIVQNMHRYVHPYGAVKMLWKRKKAFGPFGRNRAFMRLCRILSGK